MCPGAVVHSELNLVTFILVSLIQMGLTTPTSEQPHTHPAPSENAQKMNEQVSGVCPAGITNT